MSEQAVSEKLIREAAWAAWEEIDGPLARASMDAGWLELKDREKAEARLRVAFARVRPELEAEWRQEVRKRFVGHGPAEMFRQKVPPAFRGISTVNLIPALQAAFDATQPHSGQPGDQGQ